MPAKAPTLCKHPGCGSLVAGGYCAAHKTVQRADKLHGQRDYNSRRVESDRLYSTQRWRKLSIVFRRRHPLCCECERNGLVRASEVVDHMQAAKDRPDLFWDWSNLRALCNDCHSRIGVKVRG